MKKGGLGKGLDAIFAENDTEDRNSAVAIRLNEIEPNRAQPRKDFNDKALAELADSIAQHGVLQPLLVRPIPGGGYQIVAGERRWRAARMAGLSELPAVIRDLSDAEMMELALIENLQREDLTPIEEARGYKALIDEYGLTQDEIAKTVGKSRPAITNALRLLHLPQEALELLAAGKISAGHARALLMFPDEESMLEAARLTAAHGLSVRELERLAKKASEQKDAPEKERKKPRIQFFDEVELAMGEHLGRKVHVNGNQTKGVLQIEFYGEEDLNNLIHSLQFRE